MTPNADYGAVRAEAFRAVEAIGERFFTTEALEGCIKTFARHILDLTDALAKRDAMTALLDKVAHDAWHLMDDGGEADSTDDNGRSDYLVSGLDHEKLSAALDALEASGWDAHPSPNAGSRA